jgi:DNA repair photolyase
VRITSRVFPFQTSVETVRAHHWRNVTDAYSGCAFNCQYCLYKGPGDYGEHVSVARGEDTADPALGILNIGSTTDPYQPIEATQRLTRRTLEAAASAGLPVFLLTRGTLVERDADVLGELARRGLLEVCVSIITLSDVISAKIEPRAPTPRERLATASRLAELGIPVTFHVAPLIPGLNSEAHLTALGRTLGAISGRHIFCAVLGIQRAFWASFQRAMKSLGPECHDLEKFWSAYPDTINFSRTAAVTCELPQALTSLMALRSGVLESGAIFVSENFPYLSSGALTQGIYHWKLPTVYDMSEWIAARNHPVTWSEFEVWYSTFRPSSNLQQLVRDTWHSGELTLGTHLARISRGDEVEYQFIPEFLAAPAQTTVVTRRGRPQ